MIAGGHSPTRRFSEPRSPSWVHSQTPLPVFILAAAIWLLILDAPSHLDFGAFSFSGLLTILSFVLVGFTIVLNLARHARQPWITDVLPAPLLLFAIAAVLQLVYRPNFAAFQNVIVYLIFFLSIVCAAQVATPALVRRTLLLFMVCGFGAATIFIVTSFAGIESLGARSLGLGALITLSVAIPDRRHPVASLVVSAICVAGIAISLSRTALLIGLLCLVFLVVRGRRRRRHLKAQVAGGLTLVLIAWVFAVYEPIRARFLGGDAALTIGGLNFNTSGRYTLWQMTWESAMTAPWFGHGPGSVSELIGGTFEHIAHPHNDYLRVFHDFGAIGLALFLLGFVSLVVRVFRRARATDATIHWSALIALVSIGIAALTDNVIIYVFVMMPAGVLAGLSLGSANGLPPLGLAQR